MLTFTFRFSHRFMYCFLYLFTYLISLLPLKALYLLSDFCFWILFRLWGYRKAIVKQNLTLAYPQKSEKEIELISKQFYHSFCDQWIETLKLMSLSASKINKRLDGNWAVFEQAVVQGNGNVVVLLGHQFNWELGSLATPLNFSGQYAGIYLPVSSKAINRLMLHIRQRTGAMLIPANDLRNGFRQLEGKKHLLAFIADQTPGSLNVADWHLFMNRPAPFVNGPEKIARLQNAAVVWVSLRKLSRGYYQLHAELFCTNARTLPPGTITKNYVSFLEKELQQQPSNWMWTHRRWKHIPPDNWQK